VGGLLPGLELLGLEPEGDLLLGGLDGVGAVADVAADVLVREKEAKLAAEHIMQDMHSARQIVGFIS
jgi:proteasome assembly chaperone (PAC2) family protein